MDKESIKLQQEAERLINQMNHQKLSSFEGLSPSQMHQLLYDPLGEESPIQLDLSNPALFDNMPLFNLINYLGRILDREGELKLTQTGRLPIRVVSELYEQKYMAEYYIEKGFQKLYKESDALSMMLTRIIMEVMGMSKKRKNKLSLTKAGAHFLADQKAMAEKLIVTFTTGFNWAYFDDFPDDYVGQMGVGYTLFLLNKYGDDQQSPSFYVQKYVEAYPYLLRNYRSYGEDMDSLIHCYTYRTFHLFMDYLGLIKMERGMYNNIEKVGYSPLFKKIFDLVK